MRLAAANHIQFGEARACCGGEGARARGRKGLGTRARGLGEGAKAEGARAQRLKGRGRGRAHGLWMACAELLLSTTKYGPHVTPT
eukprot:3798171-Prymnesium_polylepis.1